MPYPASNPIVKVRIIQGREEPPVVLLLLHLLGCSNPRRGICSNVPLLFQRPPVIHLSLLPVPHQERQGAGQAEDHKALEDALIDLVVIIIAAG